MSEQKRATLSTISTQKGETKKVKEKSKTIRFSLTLPESNEKSCPEYNYRDLLNSAEKKNKKVQKQVNGNLDHLNSLDADDADVKRIAQNFEAKYGGVPTKRRMGKKDDYADIGAGYDESDSFIDNTDAYDEVVPEDLTTAHGGFYINSGALEFKNVEISTSKNSDSEESEKRTSSRKRVIVDTEESESEDEEKEKEKDWKKNEIQTEHIDKKQRVETNGIQKPVAKKKLVLTDEQELLKKKKVEESAVKKKSATVKSLIREKREEFDMTLELETPTKDKPSSVHDVIESVVNAARKVPKDDTSKDSSGSEAAILSPVCSDSESSREAAPPATITEQAPSMPIRQESDVLIVSLPENVPSIILEMINSIKKAVENVSEETDVFSGPVNSLLLSLETNCRKLVKSERLQIYEHLAPFVKCTKGTLMRRAKTVLLKHESTKLAETLYRLRIIVDEFMPLIKNNYDQECQKVRDEMFLANAKANSENGDVNAIKRLRTPRKRFPWPEDARRTLQEIISIQRRCFALEGNQKESFDDHFELFLKSSLFPIWPDGWISIAALKKQVRIISENNQIKKKKLQKIPKLLAPISLDISAITTISSVAPYVLSPVKNISPNAASAITVIPIPTSSSSPPKTALNGPKIKSDVKHHSPTIKSSTSDINVTVNKKHSESNVTTSAEISAVHRPKETTPVSNSLLIESSKSKSMTITSVDLRTNSTKKEESSSVLALTNNNTHDHITVMPSIPPPLTAKPSHLNQRILSEHLPKTSTLKVDVSDDCQIIDLTDTPPANIIRKPGPKSKTRYVDGAVKVKKVKELGVGGPIQIDDLRKPDAISGTQALNQIITGLTKYGATTEAAKINFTKENPSSTNEDDMEQVMKDLKELQQLQEHAKKHDVAVDLMSPSCSPVSVIAYNSSYSPNSKIQPNDLTTSLPKEKKIAPDNSAGFQDIFQKHLLFQENSLPKSTQSSNVYSNANVQPKSNYNSANNFSYSAGSISNTMNNIRYPQSSSKYTSSMNHLPTNPTGSTNHTDDFALLQNFLYQYGYHNNSGPKQKSPP